MWVSPVSIVVVITLAHTPMVPFSARESHGKRAGAPSGLSIPSFLKNRRSALQRPMASIMHTSKTDGYMFNAYLKQLGAPVVARGTLVPSRDGWWAWHEKEKMYI